MTKSRLAILALLLAATVCIRIIPYALGALGITDVTRFVGFLWNYSPLTALFLFCGAQFADRRVAYGLPLAAMLLSDIGIGVLLRDMSKGLHPLIPVIYGCYALVIWSGVWLRTFQQRFVSRNAEPGGPSTARRIRIELLSLASVVTIGIWAEVAFFLVTNFAMWVIQTDYYPHTWEGLVKCYIAGIPFFKNGLESTCACGPALFGGSALVERWLSVVGRPLKAAGETARSVVA